MQRPEPRDRSCTDDARVSERIRDDAACEPGGESHRCAPSPGSSGEAASPYLGPLHHLSHTSLRGRFQHTPVAESTEQVLLRSLNSESPTTWEKRHPTTRSSSPTESGTCSRLAAWMRRFDSAGVADRAQSSATERRGGGDGNPRGGRIGRSQARRNPTTQPEPALVLPRVTAPAVPAPEARR